MKRRTPAQRPPENAKEGAKRIRAQLVGVFDHKDGKGADWPLLLESLFRVGFEIVDEQPDDEARKALMRRIHAGAYNRLTGGVDDTGKPDRAGAAPTAAAAFQITAKPLP